jgi:hypothetical protein
MNSHGWLLPPDGPIGRNREIALPCRQKPLDFRRSPESLRRLLPRLVKKRQCSPEELCVKGGLPDITSFRKKLLTYSKLLLPTETDDFLSEFFS